MNDTIIAVILVLGILFFATAVYAFWWAAKTGQFKKLEEGAKVVFTPDEPEGEQIDFFPSSNSDKKEKNNLKKEKEDIKTKI